MKSISVDNTVAPNDLLSFESREIERTIPRLRYDPEGMVLLSPINLDEPDTESKHPLQEARLQVAAQRSLLQSPLNFDYWPRNNSQARAYLQELFKKISYETTTALLT